MTPAPEIRKIPNRLVKDGTPHTYLASVKKVSKSTMHCEYCGLPIIENGGQMIVTIRGNKWHYDCMMTYYHQLEQEGKI